MLCNAYDVPLFRRKRRRKKKTQKMLVITNSFESNGKKDRTAKKTKGKKKSKLI